MRRCWVNLQCVILLVSITVGQGTAALAVGMSGGCLDFFLASWSIIFLFFLRLSGRRLDID